MPASDHETRFPGHSGMDGVTCEDIAENAVVGVGWHASNHIARIDIFEGDGDLGCFEVRRDFVFQIQSDIEIRTPILDVAGSVVCQGLGGESACAAFRHDDQGVASFGQTVLQVREKTLRALEVEVDFWNEAIVDVEACQGCGGGNEAGISTHQLDEPNAILRADRLGMGAIESEARHFDRGIESEGFVDIRDIVVDGFGYADDRNVQAASLDLLVQGRSSA